MQQKYILKKHTFKQHIQDNTGKWKGAVTKKKVAIFCLVYYLVCMGADNRHSCLKVQRSLQHSQCKAETMLFLFFFFCLLWNFYKAQQDPAISGPDTYSCRFMLLAIPKNKKRRKIHKINILNWALNPHHFPTYIKSCSISFSHAHSRSGKALFDSFFLFLTNHWDPQCLEFSLATHHVCLISVLLFVSIAPITLEYNSKVQV